MSNFARDQQSSPLQAASASSKIAFHMIVAIGATGAPTVSYRDSPVSSITRTGTGAYTLVFPKGKYGVIHVKPVSAAGTVRGAHVLTSSMSGTAGAGTIVTTSADGTATDPANGDVLHIIIEVLV